MVHQTNEQLDAGLGRVEASPTDGGTVDMIVSRPEVDGRVIMEAAEFAVGLGLVGDNYVERGSRRTPDGSAHPDAQVTLMTAAAIDQVTGGDRDRWPLAGDQLFVNLDLSRTNLPAGTRLSIGTTVLEVTAKPHTGCAKFRERFGVDAVRWVNSSDELRLRGINANVVQAGVIMVGDIISKQST